MNSIVCFYLRQCVKIKLFCLEYLKVNFMTFRYIYTNVILLMSSLKNMSLKFTQKSQYMYPVQGNT